MNRFMQRALSGLAAVGLGATLVPLLGAAAGAAPGAQPGGAGLDPSPVETNATNFSLNPSGGATCEGYDGSGGTGGGGWRVSTFIINADADPGAINFGAGLPPGNPGDDRDSTTDGTVLSALFKGTTRAINYSPAASPAGLINPTDLSGFNFTNATWNLAAGAYQIGFACYHPSGPDNVASNADDYRPHQWWSKTVTINPAPGAGESFMVEGVADEAPVLNSVSPGDGTLTAAFTHTASDPDNTTYTATATPTGGGAAVEATGTGSPITIGGLTNGTPYSVTVRATNLAGDSPESNVVTATPAVGAQPPVSNLIVDPGDAGSTAVSLTWDAPSGGLEPSGYTVTIDPAGGTVDVVGTTATITGLTSGSPYTCTVTPTYTDPTAVATPATANCTPTATGVTVREQNVTVERPAGALVFTQICENSQTGVPLDDATFGTAPCAIAFGVAERVIPEGGGQPYFQATASLNNVMIDSFGDDTGWNVTGLMSAFVHNSGLGTGSFPGDQLGWKPKKVSTTSGLTVERGPAIAPGTGGGLGDGATLASSPAGSSLGIAELDADLTVKIPMQNKAGEYSGTLTMTAAPGA